MSDTLDALYEAEEILRNTEPEYEGKVEMYACELAIEAIGKAIKLIVEQPYTEYEPPT